MADHITAKDLVEEFTAYYKRGVKTSKITPVRGKLRHLELHPSSFPYCPLQHLNDACEAPPATYREQDFRMTAAVEFGTTFHTIIQQALGSLGQLYGNWECFKCGHKTEFSRKPICEECEGPMHYHELGVRVGKRIVGHTDGLFRLKGTKQYVVIDYKTTRSSKVKMFRKPMKKFRHLKPFFPVPHNVEQITKYAGLLELQYDVEIVGWLLLYAGRDDVLNDFVPTANLITRPQMREIKRELKKWDDQFDYVVRLKDKNELEYLIETKPCDTLDYYQTRYHDQYSPCPLAGVCFNPKLLKKHMVERVEEAQEWLPLTRLDLETAHARNKTSSKDS